MKKLLEWCRDHILFIGSIGLFIFVPLYPKFPLIDIKNTWVYVRIEDFLVLFVLFLFGSILFKRRLSLDSPLAVPFFIFFLSGILSTLHGILFIFPTLGAAHPNVAFLSLLRRMEYISLFFVAYASMREKKYISAIVTATVCVLLAVSVYGIGQKYFGFPAFLTMNEEYAKGLAIHLSRLSRISSTFGGHYDFAAYLVLILPIVISLAFGFQNMFARLILIGSSLVGLIALLMTVSRISFFALFAAVGIVLFIHKKKFVLYSIPILLIAALFFLSFSPRIFDRFLSTVKAIDVIVDAPTGEPVGHTKSVPRSYFRDKTVKQMHSRSIKNIYGYASASATLLFTEEQLPSDVTVLTEPSSPTGEDLPQGTGYINLSLSPVLSKLDWFIYEPKQKIATTSAEVFVINGNYLVKKVLTYDLSFTTRFQGQWPKAMEAFKRNILFGSGYGSIGLAVDSSYFRMIGEVGLLGFLSFFFICIAIGVYIKKTLPDVDSPVFRSFVIGLAGGLIGLLVNALFIDVFEASKVAFTIWILTGFTLGMLRLYSRKPADIKKECLAAFLSTPAIIVYITLTAFLLYSPMVRNYFIGDDFTWLRWASDCGAQNVSDPCPLSGVSMLRYFTQSNGFFYRPGAKIYFLFMYKLFWLNQASYHMVSLLLHGFAAVLVFFLSKKILKHIPLALFSGLLFLLLNGSAEAVHWISATGLLFSAAFSLLGLLSFIVFEERNEKLYMVFSVLAVALSPLFHEVGIVAPFLILLYRMIYGKTGSIVSRLKDRITVCVLLPTPIYLLMRFFSNSHWFSGDYNYNLLLFPLNALGNIFGYLMLTAFGPLSESMYQMLRNGFKAHISIAFFIMIIFFLISVFFIRNKKNSLTKQERSAVLFGSIFFTISLLPFLGLGNMSSRYSYLSSPGIIIVFMVLWRFVSNFFERSGRTIAILGTSVIIGVIVLFQVIEHQQITADWYEAGKITETLTVSLGGVYQNSWTKTPMELHFVNVPIRHSDAWVFPVGLPDVLFLLYRNPHLRVFAWRTLGEAYASVEAGSHTQKVFEFNKNGSVIERIKPGVLP